MAYGRGVTIGGLDFGQCREPPETWITMSRKIQLIRLVGSCLCVLLSSVFCQQFSEFQYRAVVFIGGVPPESLPNMCIWFTRLSPLLLAIPPVALLVGATRLLSQREPSPLVELLSQAMLVLSLALIVVCILVWQAPYATPTGDAL